MVASVSALIGILIGSLVEAALFNQLFDVTNNKIADVSSSLLAYSKLSSPHYHSKPEWLSRYQIRLNLRSIHKKYSIVNFFSRMLFESEEDHVYTGAASIENRGE